MLRPDAMILIITATFIAPIHAQKLVYKCGANTYSNEPCINAIEIDTTPTRGMDKSSGISRKSTGLQRQELQEAAADGTRPLTGMSRDQFAANVRRHPLQPKERAECSTLDSTLEAGRTRRTSNAADDVALYKARKRFNDLNC